MFTSFIAIRPSLKQRLLGVTILSLFIVPTLGSASAQEPDAPADGAAESASDNPYFDLRKSTDRVTRQWAERYFNLVKFQEWASDKGTTIKAKYISHKPDLSSVTLLVVRGSGANRVEREVAVPVAKLNKSGQSRVKQIDVTQKKLDELIAGGATAGESGQPPGQPAVDPGAPMNDEQGAEPKPRRSTTRTRTPRSRETAAAPASPTAPATSSSVADDGNPDPLGFAELPAPSGPPMTATFAAPGAVPDVVPATGNLQPAKAAAPQDKGDWRTSYDVFRNSIRVSTNPIGADIDWGPMKELEAAVREVEKQEADQSVDEEELAMREKAFNAVGEFTWEATLADADTSAGDWTDRLNLPPLPEPLTIGFILDENAEPAAAQNLQTGQRVRFTGRFVDVEMGTDLVAQIRFEAQPAATK